MDASSFPSGTRHSPSSLENIAFANSRVCYEPVVRLCIDVWHRVLDVDMLSRDDLDLEFLLLDSSGPAGEKRDIVSRPGVLGASLTDDLDLSGILPAMKPVCAMGNPIMELSGPMSESNAQLVSATPLQNDLDDPLELGSLDAAEIADPVDESLLPCSLRQQLFVEPVEIKMEDEDSEQRKARRRMQDAINARHKRTRKKVLRRVSVVFTLFVLTVVLCCALALERDDGAAQASECAQQQPRRAAAEAQAAELRRTSRRVGGARHGAAPQASAGGGDERAAEARTVHAPRLSARLYIGVHFLASAHFGTMVSWCWYCVRSCSVSC